MSGEALPLAVKERKQRAASTQGRCGGKEFGPFVPARLVSPRGMLPEAVLAVDRPRPVGLEGHLRRLAAIGTDDVVHLPRPAVEPSAASASVSIHVSNSCPIPRTGRWPYEVHV